MAALCTCVAPTARTTYASFETVVRDQTSPTTAAAALCVSSARNAVSTAPRQKVHPRWRRPAREEQREDSLLHLAACKPNGDEKAAEYVRWLVSLRIPTHKRCEREGRDCTLCKRTLQAAVVTWISKCGIRRALTALYRASPTSGCRMMTSGPFRSRLSTTLAWVSF